MKKIFLIIMLFLLPLQYAWAMVASYDTHNTYDTEAHFGHHEHDASLSTSDLKANSSQPDNQGTKSLESHLHLGFSHLSCGELIGYAMPVFEQQIAHTTTPYLFIYHSPPSYQLERPNWMATV